MGLIYLQNTCELLVEVKHTEFMFFFVCFWSVYGESKYCFAYNAYGVTCAEVEVDVLTGQTEVKRVDILYDCGQRLVIEEGLR